MLIASLSFLFLVFWFLPLPEVETGLAVDQNVNEMSAAWGSECNYYAYLAFRVPILEIIVETMGQYEEQNVQIYKYESFNFTRPNQGSVMYSYVPSEYHHLTCSSKAVPLMCQMENSDTGYGHCVCLHMDFSVTKDDGSVVSHSVDTAPSKPLPSVVSRSPKDSSIPEKTTPAVTDTNTTVAGNAAEEDEYEEPDEEYIAAMRGFPDIECQAKPSTFCGTPFISCRPYEDERGYIATDCVDLRCTGIIMQPTYHLFILLSCLCFYL